MPVALLGGSQYVDSRKRVAAAWYRFEKAPDISLTVAQHREDRRLVSRQFAGAWKALVTLRKKAIGTIGKKKDKDSPQRTYSFDDALNVVRDVANEFGHLQNDECMTLKEQLQSKDPSGSGLVPLHSFYFDSQGKLDHHFEESPEYLRSMGVLDETLPPPQVLIANFIAGPSNCVLSASQYKICCIPECQGILGYFESKMQAPVGSPTQILSAAANMYGLRHPTAGMSLEEDSPLAQALQQVASMHGGKVPLHSRLFAQWLHVAFPSECPYPHPSGYFEYLTPDEYQHKTGVSPDIGKNDLSVVSYTRKMFQNASIAGQDDPLSQWTLVEEMLAGPIEEDEDSNFHVGILGGAIGGASSLGLLLLVNAILMWRSPKVAPES